MELEEEHLKMCERVVDLQAELERVRAEHATARAAVDGSKNIIADFEFEVGSLREAKEKAEAELDNINADRVFALSELKAATARIFEMEVELVACRPYMEAIRSRHNGYDPDYRSQTGTSEPESPEAALDQLIDEATAMGVMEGQGELAEMKEECERLVTDQQYVTDLYNKSQAELAAVRGELAEVRKRSECYINTLRDTKDKDLAACQQRERELRERVDWYWQCKELMRTAVYLPRLTNSGVRELLNLTERSEAALRAEGKAEGKGE